MTSRRSSGSSRAESAVEPTRSQNITVSCRRSASAGAGASRDAAVTAAAGTAAPSAAIASSSRRRCPTEVTPRSFRSSAVSSAAPLRRSRCRGTPARIARARASAANLRHPSPTRASERTTAVSYVFAGIATVARMAPPHKRPSFGLGSHQLDACFIAFRRDGQMSLFLVLFWSSIVVRATPRANSRFGGLIPRVGPQNSPLMRLRELAGKILICLTFLVPERHFSRTIRQNSRFRRE